LPLVGVGVASDLVALAVLAVAALLVWYFTRKQ